MIVTSSFLHRFCTVFFCIYLLLGLKFYIVLEMLIFIIHYFKYIWFCFPMLHFDTDRECKQKNDPKTNHQQTLYYLYYSRSNCTWCEILYLACVLRTFPKKQIIEKQTFLQLVIMRFLEFVETSHF